MFNYNNPNITLIYARPGHGKTTMIKKIVKRIAFHHFCIVGSSIHDDYNEESLKQMDIANALRLPDLDEVQVEAFRNREGIKLLVMDDILHISGFGNQATFLKDLFSTSRHKQLYIIVGVQLMKTLTKALRFCAHIFLAGSIDSDSLPTLTALSGRSKNHFIDIRLNMHEFIGVSNSGIVGKIGRFEEDPTQASINEADTSNDSSDT